MKFFTGWEYLLIDVANHFGLDKLRFEERIEWATHNLDQLEQLVDRAEAKPLYVKTVMAIRAAQRGEPSGHLVAFDAVCSGIQIMSALTGCVAGAESTGLIDPDRRADAYSSMTEVMNHILALQGRVGVAFPRKDVKYATMTSVYGSKAVPKRLFGQATPELAAFYSAANVVAPGAFALLDDLLDSWRPYALSHEWVLPDNFHAKIKVMQTVEHKIEVDELDHATFSYEYLENVGTEKGLANAANVVHSIDAYVLRSLVRRCNYDRDLVAHAHALITAELLQRQLWSAYHEVAGSDPTIDHYIELYNHTKMADTVILPYLYADNVCLLTTEHLRKLNGILATMLEHRPFPVITIHDSFAAHANNMNTVRYWYKELLAELAESEVLSHILSQIYGEQCTYLKLDPDLGTKIRQSSYALC